MEKLRKKLLEIFDQLSSLGKKQLTLEASRILNSEAEILKLYYNPEASTNEENTVSIFEDELTQKAIELALEYGQISISMLQCRLKIGYAQAARIVDEMETNHLISASDGSKPRQVIITWDEYHKRFDNPI